MFNLFKRNKIDLAELQTKKIIVESKRCPQNHRCPSVRVCPVGAITQEGFAAPKINKKKCIKCGKCLTSCPFGAFQAS